MIYLDNAATSWPKPERVYTAVNQCMTHMGANPGRGGYDLARAASSLLYDAREKLAWLFNVKNATDIAFTYNATDALNMALFGLFTPGETVVTTSMEHNAVARPLKVLAQAGVKVHIVKCDIEGKLATDGIEQALQGGVRAVVMSHASNIVGTVMPLEEIGRLTAKYNALFIVDAAQTAGVEHIDVAAMNIDLLAFSGHKGLLGSQGTGGLYVRPGLTVKPLRFGGTGSLSESDVQPAFMPDCLESGTPNTPGIAGLAAGVDFIRATGRENIRAKEKQLTDELLVGLKDIPQVTVYGPKNQTQRTAVVSFNINGQDSGVVAHCLDRDFGIACRAGLHCAPWAHQTIGTFTLGTIRLSPGFFNHSGDIHETIRAVERIARKEARE